MTPAEWLQVAAILVPIIAVQLADGARTRARVDVRLALLERAARDERREREELGRRQARHERDPVHRLLGHRP